MIGAVASGRGHEHLAIHLFTVLNGLCESTISCSGHGYRKDVMGWKNMMSFSGNIQTQPTVNNHIVVWYTNLHLANPRGDWYRASQGVYIL